MYGHAHLLLDLCRCGKAGVSVDQDGERTCARCALEREKRDLPASQDFGGRVPAPR